VRPWLQVKYGILVLRISESSSCGITIPPQVDPGLKRLITAIGPNSDGKGMPPALILPFSIHGSDGRLLFLCPRAADFLDCREANKNRNFLEFLHVQDRVEAAHFVSSSQNSGIDPSVELFECRTLSGVAAGLGKCTAAKWLELGRSELDSSQYGKNYVIITYRDITSRKENEIQLQHMREDAERESIAKSRFLANTSHELRTPLNAILGFSELLNSPLIENFSQEKRQEYVGLIHDSASHLLSVLNDILDMSKIETGKYEIFSESFNLAKCLENTVAIMQGQAGMKSISLISHGFDELPEIVADQRAIRQIMINLLSNAIKFSNANSAVEIRAKRKARSVQLTVVDNGIGISSEHLENLGKPFFQADSKYDRKYEGTGLGISVVKGLLELHKGSLEFRSKRGQGTSVTVSLPIHGQSGRQVPGEDKVEKITSIATKLVEKEHQLRIIRNSA
jgi:cell cycle sensor histidine kinase DivJ